ncbi:MAG TPA: DUF2207 domain-containing protein, partial [Chloroflexota bacterium]|nr:DUF2207 domain-containing protein [Chloroflexota bacterium]
MTLDRHLRTSVLWRCAVVAWLVGALVWAGLGWLSAPAAAQDRAQSVRAVRYDVDLGVEGGGSVVVTETQEIAFQGGPFRQGFRRIPLNRVEGIHEVQVGEPGRPYQPGRDTPNTFAVSGATGGAGPGGGDLLIEWWFTPTADAARTFVVRYRATGAVRYYEGGDQ